MAKNKNAHLQGLFGVNDDKGIDEIIELMPSRTKGQTLMDIPLGLIRPDPNQPRKEYTEEDLDGLYQRILATGGVSKPIDVRVDPENSDRYIIEDGEMRYVVYRTRYESETIPCRVLINSKDDMGAVLVKQLMANIGGIDMTMFDVAKGLERVRTEFTDKPRSTANLAEMFGWSKTKVSRLLKLVRASESVQAFAEEKGITNINTLSSMVDVYEKDPDLFEQSLSDESATAEAFWAEIKRDLNAPTPTKDNQSSQEGDSSVSDSRDTVTESGSVDGDDTGGEVDSKGERKVDKPKKPDVIDASEVHIERTESGAVLHLSYLVGKKTLTSEYALSLEQLASLLEQGGVNA